MTCAVLCPDDFTALSYTCTVCFPCVHSVWQISPSPWLVCTLLKLHSASNKPANGGGTARCCAWLEGSARCETSRAHFVTLGRVDVCQVCVCRHQSSSYTLRFYLTLPPLSATPDHGVKAQKGNMAYGRTMCAGRRPKNPNGKRNITVECVRKERGYVVFLFASASSARHLRTVSGTDIPREISRALYKTTFFEV